MPRILLIDDEEPLRRLLSSFLGKNGSGVVACATPAEAWIQLQQNGPFDAVVLDLWLDGEDGLVLLGRMLSEFAGIRVLTASGAPADLTNFHLTPAQRLGFLQKPFLPRDLLRALDELLQE